MLPTGRSRLNLGHTLDRALNMHTFQVKYLQLICVQFVGEMHTISVVVVALQCFFAIHAV